MDAAVGGLELVAGDPRELLLALAVGDTDALADPERAVAYLPLGDLDPAWLDALTAAVHDRTGRGPASFRAGLRPLPARLARMVEAEVRLVDEGWLRALADLGPEAVDAVARRWLARRGEPGPSPEAVALAAEIAAAVVRFTRRAATAEAVLCVSAFPLDSPGADVGDRDPGAR